MGRDSRGAREVSKRSGADSSGAAVLLVAGAGRGLPVVGRGGEVESALWHRPERNSRQVRWYCMIVISIVLYCIPDRSPPSVSQHKIMEAASHNREQALASFGEKEDKVETVSQSVSRSVS